MVRDSMSRPVPSPPRKWPGWIGGFSTISAKLLLGSGRGRIGARMATEMISTIQMIENQPRKPSFLLCETSTSSGVAATASMPPSTGASTSGSGMADPWVDHRVQQVHGEVHEDEEDGQDGHEALQGHVLPLRDRGEDLLAHAR